MMSFPLTAAHTHIYHPCGLVEYGVLPLAAKCHPGYFTSRSQRRIHTHLWMGDIMFRFIPFGVHNGVTMVSQVHLVPPVHRDAYTHVSGWETSCLVFVLSGVYNGGSRGIPGTPSGARAIPPLVLGVL